MTAFGRANIDSPLGRWVAEVHCVNRKMLDINISLPKDFLRFDMDIRKWIGEAVQRGQVTVRIVFDLLPSATTVPPSYVESLQALKKSWGYIASELGFDPKKEIDLPFLCRQMEELKVPENPIDDAMVLEDLKKVLGQALKQLLEMKTDEGRYLQKDIVERLNAIEISLGEIKKRGAGATEVYRVKLQERIAEVVSIGAECDDRILREVALFAERIDITEEITRLYSHLEQFRKQLSSEEKSVGRSLDFMSQEINREIHTIAAKAVDGEIISLSVMMRAELEKIREQVQNIE